MGCRVRFEYPTCKLLDFSEAELAEENSPVAIVILAQRAAQRRVESPGERKTLKWDLTRRLYERGYCQEEVVELFRLIDWLLKLPEDLEVEFQRLGCRLPRGVRDQGVASNFGRALGP